MSKKILIIEDDVVTGPHLKKRLERRFKNDYEECSIFLAHDGEEGYSISQSQIPDIVLTDIMMPLLNGLETAKLIKSSKVTGKVPIIALTALETDRKADNDSIFSSYIKKPIDFEHLVDIVIALADIKKR